MPNHGCSKVLAVKAIISQMNHCRHHCRQHHRHIRMPSSTTTTVRCQYTSNTNRHRRNHRNRIEYVALANRRMRQAIVSINRWVVSHDVQHHRRFRIAVKWHRPICSAIIRITFNRHKNPIVWPSTMYLHRIRWPKVKPFRWQCRSNTHQRLSYRVAMGRQVFLVHRMTVNTHRCWPNWSNRSSKRKCNQMPFHPMTPAFPPTNMLRPNHRRKIWNFRKN